MSKIVSLPDLGGVQGRAFPIPLLAQILCKKEKIIASSAALHTGIPGLLLSFMWVVDFKKRKK